MLDSNKIEELANKFSQSIPVGAKNFQQDIEKTFKTLLQSLVDKMELVTREEFDLQTKVLQRTRDKLEALELLVAELEPKEKQ